MVAAVVEVVVATVVVTVAATTVVAMLLLWATAAGNRRIGRHVLLMNENGMGRTGLDWDFGGRTTSAGLCIALAYKGK